MAKMKTSNFYCTKCGKQNIPIQRNDGREREGGHLKALWCLFCNERVNAVEIKEMDTNYTYNDFLNEFNLHNFDEEGNRKKSLKDFKAYKQILYEGHRINEKGEKIIGEQKE